MKSHNIFKTKEQNYYIKERGIPRGCKLCLKGAKAVLFLNGICQNPPHCAWYCPISEKRKNKKDTYLNEIYISQKAEIFEELSKMNAKGMSITGGEPLFGSNLEKTIKYIQLTKKIKGPTFHIHLYTNGVHFNEAIGQRLSKAGLDEIRFHPAPDRWDCIKQALNWGIDVGAEVPVIPEDEYKTRLKRFIIYLDEIGADFVNLNEFEYCFPNSTELRKRGFALKKGTIASVQNSKEIALSVINTLAPSTELKLHFCSIKAKDYYQLKKRYTRRANSIKTPYEEVTDEGLLLYGQIEGDKEELEHLYNYLLHESGIPQELVIFEEEGILLPYYVLMDEEFLAFLNNFNVKGFVIESLPFDKHTEKTYRQITEKTPIRLFKKEMEYDES